MSERNTSRLRLCLLVLMALGASLAAEAQSLSSALERLKEMAEDTQELGREIGEATGDELDRSDDTTDDSPPAPVSAGGAVAGGSATLESYFLAPEGLRMGMPIREAKNRLTSRGYTPGSAGCRFQRPRPGGGRIELTLNIRETGAGADPSSSILLQANCAAGSESGVIVTGLKLKEFVDRASQSVDPLAEIQRIAERWGPYGTCARLESYGATACVWRAPPADPAIKTVTVSISPSWGRELAIEAELVEALPLLPGRAAQIETRTAEATAICENASGDELFRALHDCRCIAEKVGKAYARGQVDRIDASVLGVYKDNCPSSREQLRAHFEERCLDSFGVRETAWAAGGGCRCVGDKGAEAYLSDPRSSIPWLTGVVSSSAMACGYVRHRSVVPEEYRTAAPAPGSASDRSVTDARDRAPHPAADTEGYGHVDERLVIARQREAEARGEIPIATSDASASPRQSPDSQATGQAPTSSAGPEPTPRALPVNFPFDAKAQPGRLAVEGLHLGMIGSQVSEALEARGYLPIGASNPPESFARQAAREKGDRGAIGVRYAFSRNGVNVPAAERPVEQVSFSLVTSHDSVEAEQVFQAIAAQQGDPDSPCTVHRPHGTRWQCVWTREFDGSTEQLRWQAQSRGYVAVELSNVQRVSR